MNMEALQVEYDKLIIEKTKQVDERDQTISHWREK